MGNRCTSLLASEVKQKRIGSDTWGSDGSFFQPKKRRASDASLQKILKDALVVDAFRQFMNLEFAEHKLSFWLEAEAYERLPFDSPEKKNRAQDIYTKYLAEQAASKLDIDEATIIDIKENLEIDESGKVQQSNIFKLKKVFMLAFGKVFTQLKFDYLPRFLLSDFFQNLDGKIMKKYFMEKDDIVMTASQIIVDMDIGYILSNPWGNFYFQEFLYSTTDAAQEARQYKGTEVLELIHEIEDFRSAIDNEHRQKRIEKIFKRFSGSNLNIPEIDRMKQSFEAKPSLFSKADGSLFDGIWEKAVMILDRDLFPLFKCTIYYLKLASVMTQSKQVGEKLELYTRHKLTEKKVQELKDFAMNRNIGKTPEEEFKTLAKVLEDSLGVYYFKKHARKNFQEESILFWIEVDNFQRGEFTHPSEGTMILTSLDKSKHELMIQRGKRICEKYIENSGNLCININSSMRSKILEASKSNTLDQHSFDEAQAEILKLMELNLWDSFLRTKMYKSFLRIHEGRFMRRQRVRVGK